MEKFVIFDIVTSQARDGGMMQDSPAAHDNYTLAFIYRKIPTSKINDYSYFFKGYLGYQVP